MVLAAISKTVTKVFGSRNDRILKGYRRRVEQIGTLEPQMRALTDAQLKAKTEEFRGRLAQGEAMAGIIPQALAVAREVMDRAVGIRSIFNPEHQFDPRKLPADLQTTYEQTAQQAAQIAPAAVLGGGDTPLPGWMQVDIPLALYDAVRAIYPQSRPPFRARPFDVQLIGGMVLFEGRIAEMKTGEGKTIVSPLACWLACLENLQCHVVTVNDYLVQRDRDWVFPFYHHLGLSVGAIHPMHMQSREGKSQAYACNVVYGTNSEFGFDYLRDNMALTAQEQFQKQRDFVIIDEVDSILIDEARTPLIISGPAHEDSPRYELADQLARHLMNRQRQWDQANEKVDRAKMRIKGIEGDIRNTADKSVIPPLRQEMQELRDKLPALETERDKFVQYYEVERDKKQSHLTHEGVAEAQKEAKIGSFYVGNNMDVPHLLENALRAHVIYQRDKDYVVQNGEVIIVDEFTGRLMVGRQWSDGLHQAVEAKEKVKVKQETQTMATVTIQNFFKLYRRRAGMTGTAMTEAHEFNEIYTLEVVQIPTNVPCIRNDLEDIIYVSQKDKWQAILDEIKRMHDMGRPVLVGTTSVENSEILSQMLTRKYGVKHEVLNAKQHEREAHIVLHAGELGAVMIATNMAGRGTDIKLSPVARDALVRHWQLRNLLPREAKPDMTDQELLDLSWLHQARITLGLSPADAKALTLADARLRLMRRWVQEYTFTDPDKADRMDAEACIRALDKLPNFLHHRPRIYTHIEEMGGLHIVGTERHESRRIDNQLRGRAGRQGDRGSSRFFISLEDDLMKLFANKAVLTALSKLGMKEGVAIEHHWITKSVERAQRKVEERNFEIRKNLLEYDEVANYQRSHFYGIRQEVLEGKDIPRLIFDYIADAVEDAADLYLDRDYVPGQVANWCAQELEVAIEPYKLRDTELRSLQQTIFESARDDMRQTIELTIGEYMSDDVPAEEWDTRGLASWAMSRFKVDLKQNQLRSMSPLDVRNRLTEAALEQLDKRDLSGVAKFLEPGYAHRDLAEWAKTKFSIEVDPQKLGEMPRPEVGPFLLGKARDAYQRRELEYPVDFVLEMAFTAAQQDGRWAAEQLAAWINRRFDLSWQPEEVARYTGNDLKTKLMEYQKEWLVEGRLEKTVKDAVAAHQADPAALQKWLQERFGQEVTVEDLKQAADPGAFVLARARESLRGELTQLERFVLLSILDSAWKDHLYAMDQLRDAVSLRAYAEQDPRIVYKQEGAVQFNAMQAAVRDRVTDLIFRARLTPNVQVRNVYQGQQTQHAEAGSVFQQARPQASQEQEADQEAAQRAGAQSEAAGSRHARRAAAAGHTAERSEAPVQQKRPQFKDRKRRH